jgi:hypothetical protein
MGLVYEGGILGGDYTLNLGRDQEAAGVLERAFEITDARVHQDANDQNSRGRLEMAGYPLANLLRHTDARRSLEVYDHTLRHLGEVPSNPNVQLYQARALAGSSYSLRIMGRSKEARERLDAAFQLLLQSKMYPADRIPLGSGAHRALAALADWNAESGNVVRALALYQELLDKVQGDPAKILDDALDQSTVFTGMAAIERRAGHAAQASALDARRLELWRGWDKKLPGNAYVLRQIAQALHP